MEANIFWEKWVWNVSMEGTAGCRASKIVSLEASTPCLVWTYRYWGAALWKHQCKNPQFPCRYAAQVLQILQKLKSTEIKGTASKSICCTNRWTDVWQQNQTTSINDNQCASIFFLFLSSTHLFYTSPPPPQPEMPTTRAKFPSKPRLPVQPVAAQVVHLGRFYLDGWNWWN